MAKRVRSWQYHNYHRVFKNLQSQLLTTAATYRVEIPSGASFSVVRSIPPKRSHPELPVSLFVPFESSLHTTCVPSVGVQRSLVVWPGVEMTYVDTWDEFSKAAERIYQQDPWKV